MPSVVAIEPKPWPRRLMVVLHADMVGYSRLIGQDDDGTFLRLRLLRREVIDPALAAHDGALRNSAGDALLATFDSIDHAVDAALAMQAGIAQLERAHTQAGGSPADAIRFRIGINIGDVILDGHDLYGDGINVAARLQASCPPGRICVSRAIRDHARQRRDLGFEPLGPLTLKNIDKPVEAFLIAAAATGRVRRALAAFPAWRLRRAYAVLAALVPLVSLLGFGYRYYVETGASLVQVEQVAALTASQRALAEAIARDKGVPLSVIERVLARLEESAASPRAEGDETPADLQKRLEAKADEFVALRRQLQQLTGDDSAAPGLRATADAALGRGQLAEAQELLRRAAGLEMATTTALLERARARADTAAGLLAKSAEIAAVTLRYRDAAADLGRAAAVIAPFDRRAQWAFEMQRGAMLRRQGDEFGDSDALVAAIECDRAALTLVPREEDGPRWAQTEYVLGGALTALGAREWGAERLEQAVSAFQAALSERTRETAPRAWARTETSLANALMRLSEHQQGTVRLRQAADALQAVLLFRTREDDPLGWAMAQDTLGNVLHQIGVRERSIATLEQALAAHRAAIEILQRDRHGPDWGLVQNDLGVTLAELGAREPGSDRLQQAITAYQEALSVRARDRFPLFWARTMNNLGGALFRLAAREDGTARYAEAIAAYRAALEERTAARTPRDRAETQSRLGRALLALAERQAGTQDVAAAAQAFRDALATKDRALEPLAWARAQADLGLALLRTGERESGTGALHEALAAFTAAVSEPSTDRAPTFRALTETWRGWTLYRLGEREPERAAAALRFQEALAVGRRVAEAGLLEPTRSAQNLIGVALFRLGQRNDDPARLHEAIETLQAALATAPRTNLPLWQGLTGNLAVALQAAGEQEGDTALLERALAAHRDVLATLPKARSPYAWARRRCYEALDLAQLGVREDGTARLLQAAAAFADCLPLLGPGNTEPLLRESEAGRDLVAAELAGRREAKP